MRERHPELVEFMGTGHWVEAESCLFFRGERGFIPYWNYYNREAKDSQHMVVLRASTQPWYTLYDNNLSNGRQLYFNP